VFAARGQRFAPTPVVKVQDPNGKVLEDNRKRQGDQVIEQVVADNETDILRGVISGGTGTGANINRPAAGKTGTGENFTNAWFVGFTPTLSTAVWMGKSTGEDPSKPEYSLRGVRGLSRVYGGTIPAATWRAFMTVALKDVPVTDFSQPAPIRSVADALERKARGGFDPGARRDIGGPDSGGPYEVDVPSPVAVPPPTTSTTDPRSPPSTGLLFP
jgi:penicillin-binding protein 1A